MTKRYVFLGLLLIAAIADRAFGEYAPLFAIVTSETSHQDQNGLSFKAVHWLVRNMSEETLFVPESYNPQSPQELQLRAQTRAAAADPSDIPGSDSRYRYKRDGKWSEWMSARDLGRSGYRWAAFKPRQELSFPFLWTFYDETPDLFEAVEIRLPYKQNGVQFLITLAWTK